MPRLTRWFIKTALIYLVLALLTGLIVAAGSSVEIPDPLANLTPLYFQLLMAGWITQLIFGVANWMFPIFTREEPRRSPLLGWSVYILFNTGLLLHIIAEGGQTLGAFFVPSWSFWLAALLQFVAATAFVFNTWNRIKGH